MTITRSAYLNQPYVKTLRELVDMQPGELREVTIYHDPDCPRLIGGLCTCSPELDLLNRRERRARKRSESP